uniref:Reverse transcriptase domain-containing protein n=1 Tax=Lactuca sativa TaxID=4236 RepID=A0A9R1X3V9_LACSA|nr:hypothetical protein LSAT_V11C700377210 [Lactuca sativa]
MKNTIHELMMNGSWVSDIESIKFEALHVFINKFKELHTCLSDVDCAFLKGNFSLDEIKNDIWNCGGDTASGLDAFTFQFINKYCNVMQDDVMRFVKYFEASGRFARAYDFLNWFDFFLKWGLETGGVFGSRGLNSAMKSACQSTIFRGIQIPNNGTFISHLFYADDAIFFWRLVQFQLLKYGEDPQMFSSDVWFKGKLP